MSLSLRAALVAALCLTAVACSDVEEDDKGHGHTHGVITALDLTFTPQDGGEAETFTWSDSDLTGDPVIDEIVLEDAGTEDAHAARTFRVTIEAWNELENPVEDVTPDIETYGTEHWFFFTGAAVQSTATGDNPDAVISQAYLDSDDNGLPIGLDNEVVTLSRGSGQLVVSLRHLVPEDGTPTKVAGLDTLIATDGFDALPGGNDVQVVFPVTVQ